MGSDATRWNHPQTLVAIHVGLILTLSALSILFSSPPLATAAGGATAALSLSCIIRKGGMVRAYTIVLALITAALLAGDASAQAVTQGLDHAGRFAAFLSGLYALRSAVETNPALDRTRTMLRGLTGKTRRSVLLFMSWLFSIPLAVGALSVMAPLVSVDANEEERLEAATYGIRGLALSVLCSPFTVAMALVSGTFPKVPLVVFIMTGLPFSVLALIIPLAAGSYGSPLAAGPALWRQISKVLAPIGLLVCLYGATMAIFHLPALAAGIVVVTPFAFAVAASGGAVRLKRAVSITRGSWGRFDTEMTMFTSALVLAAVTTSSPAVLALVERLSHLVGPAILIVGTLVLICGLSMTGVHMAVPAAITLSVLGPLMPDTLTKAALGMSVLMGWAFGAMTALGSISFLVAVNMYAVPPRRLAFGPNMAFMLCLCAAFSATVLVVLRSR